MGYVKRNDFSFVGRLYSIVSVINHILFHKRPQDITTDEGLAKLYKDKLKRTFFYFGGNKKKRIPFFNIADIQYRRQIGKILQKRRYYMEHKDPNSRWEWEVRKTWSKKRKPRLIKKVVH